MSTTIKPFDTTRIKKVLDMFFQSIKDPANTIDPRSGMNQNDGVDMAQKIIEPLILENPVKFCNFLDWVNSASMYILSEDDTLEQLHIAD